MDAPGFTVIVCANSQNKRMSVNALPELRLESTQHRPLSGGLTHNTTLLTRSNGTLWVCKRSLGRNQSGLKTEAYVYSLLTPTRFALPVEFHQSETGPQTLLRPYIEGTSITDWAALDIEQVITLLKRVHQITHARHGKVIAPTGLTLNPAKHLTATWRYFRSRTAEHAKLTKLYYSLHPVLQAHQPCFDQLCTFTLNHGDFHPGNLIVTPAQQLIPIDWERAHFGDPAFDLALLNWHGYGPIVDSALQIRAIALYTQCPAEQIQLQKRVICWSLLRLFNDYLYLTHNKLTVEKVSRFEEELKLYLAVLN
ncbi:MULTISPECIES: aminoglycoside phosphotransferase family protein [unclassified Pseudoalteromonas]|uniref:phosphotransferase family protein n=1 Tax=unclassified Pseudoalteromonas TaxID=194690 RepID=UPI0020979397|nr:aminoglycoside phosphotransferase family protein [Pseudoalteromonas sp. XMcav2-N]MCO7190329.1 aminoglycoside phosphotransferase family protein [Pseudoalteromonas sp. XMcav2-N]